MPFYWMQLEYSFRTLTVPNPNPEPIHESLFSDANTASFNAPLLYQGYEIKNVYDPTSSQSFATSGVDVKFVSALADFQATFIRPPRASDASLSGFIPRGPFYAEGWVVWTSSEYLILDSTRSSAHTRKS